MYRDILTNKWVLGGVGFLIVFGVGCVLWYQHGTADERKAAADAEAQLRQSEIAKKVSDTDSVAEQAADVSVESDTLTAEKSIKPRNQKKALTPPDFSKLSPEQRQHVFDSFYTQHGLKVPPRGYTYLWESPGVPKLDEDGKPILHKRGEPIVEIKMGKAFTPTLEEYEMLKLLDVERGWAKLQGDTVKAEQLAVERKQLYDSVFRERPIIGMIMWVAPKAEKQADPDKGQRIAKEKLRAALIDHGYSYLIPILEEKGGL